MLLPAACFAAVLLAVGGATVASVGVTPSHDARASAAGDAAPVTYSVTFTESGLATGTKWTVTLGSTPASSTTTTIAFTDANGSYSFTVTAVAGYTVSPATGTVKVAGAPVEKLVGFTAVSHPGSSTGFLGLSGNTGYYVLGGLLVAVGAFLAAVAFILVRRRPPPKKPGSQPPPKGG